MGLSAGKQGEAPQLLETDLGSHHVQLQEVLDVFPHDWPRTVTRPIGTHDWPEEQPVLCLRPLLLLGKRRVSFSSQRLHPEAVPCVLQHLWRGQTGWPRQMCVCGGEGKCRGRSAVGVVSSRSHTQRPELVFLGWMLGVSHESGVWSPPTLESTRSTLLASRLLSFAFVMASFIRDLRNCGPSTASLLPLQMLPPPTHASP